MSIEQARSLIFLSDCISVSSNNHIKVCGNLPICVLRCWFWNKQWSPSNLSLGRELWVRIHLVHRCFVEFDDVIVRTVSKGINTIFIQIGSLYLLLLNPRRLLKKVKSKTPSLTPIVSHSPNPIMHWVIDYAHTLKQEAIHRTFCVKHRPLNIPQKQKLTEASSYRYLYWKPCWPSWMKSITSFLLYCLLSFQCISSNHRCLSNTKPTMWMTCCSAPVCKMVSSIDGAITG